MTEHQARAAAAVLAEGLRDLRTLAARLDPPARVTVPAGPRAELLAALADRLGVPLAIGPAAPDGDSGVFERIIGERLGRPSADPGWTASPTTPPRSPGSPTG
ncbi:hypothetical protein ACFQ3Z_42905 [Streptomyces nogalater]